MKIVIQEQIEFKDRWFKEGNKYVQIRSAQQRLTGMTFLSRYLVPQMPTPPWTADCSTSRSYHKRLKRLSSLREHLSI